MIDERTELGGRVAGHLREATLVWLKTVTPSGAPLPRPAGSLPAGGDHVTVYSQPGARVRNIRHNQKVTLNFRGDPNGGDIVVLTGLAEMDERAPSAAENSAWVDKYAKEWARAGMLLRTGLQDWQGRLVCALSEAMSCVAEAALGEGKDFRRANSEHER